MPSQYSEEEADPLATSKPGARRYLEERHKLAVRWMHWVNFPLLMIMIWSGLMLYWADSAAPGFYEHRVYRVGWGQVTLLRLFPDWFYRLLRLDNHLTRGLGFHALAMWPFTLNGVAYVLYLAISGEWRTIVPGAHELRRLPGTLAGDLRRREGVAQHPGEKYNPAQRVAYTLVLALGALSVLSGIAIWKPESLPFAAMIGGYAAARLVHFWTTMGFVAFLVLHIVQVVRAGWPAFVSMVSGCAVRSEPAVDEEPEGVYGD